MKLAISISSVVLASSFATGCAAPRDPELEKQVLLARRNPPDSPDDDQAPSTPAVTPAAERPLKSYSGEEIQNVLAGIGPAPAGASTIVAVLTTDKGVINCTLDERAPQTVTNFVGLATGQIAWKADANSEPKKTMFYDGLSFHRIVTDFIIQTGNPTGKTNAGPGWRLAREQGANDLFLQPGAMGVIDDGDAMHGSQFFITAKTDRGLGNTYTAFGHCAEVDLVKAISEGEKKANGDGKQPAVPVVISSVKIERRN